MIECPVKRIDLLVLHRLIKDYVRSIEVVSETKQCFYTDDTNVVNRRVIRVIPRNDEDSLRATSELLNKNGIEFTVDCDPVLGPIFTWKECECRHKDIMARNLCAS